MGDPHNFACFIITIDPISISRSLPQFDQNILPFFLTPSKRILCLETFIFFCQKYPYNCFTCHFQLAKLTNNYYHCIPQRDYVYEKIEPICNKEKYKKELRYLSNLLDIECAEKIVIGAQSKLSSKSLSRFYNSD